MIKSEKSINRRIWQLAFPAMAGNVTIPLLGLVDTAVVGHLGSEVFIAAIAAGGMMMNVVVWLCGFLRMSTVGITSAALGASNWRGCVLALRRSAMWGALIGVGVIIFQIPLLWLLINLISPSAETSELASTYFRICSWGLPVSLAVMGMSGWMIGMQNTLYPMLLSVAVNMLNIVFSLTAVFVFNAGFEGVAYGTLLANICSLPIAIVCVRMVARKYAAMRGVKVRGKEVALGAGSGRFFSMSSELFFRSACIMGVSMTITALGARMGDTVIASNALLMQFFMLFSYFMDGLAYSAEALCGKAAGARDGNELRRSIRILVVWGGGITLLFTLLYYCGFGAGLRLLTDSETVISYASTLKWSVVMIPVMSGSAFLFDGVFVGLSATRRMLLTTLSATAVFAVVVSLFPSNSNQTLWIAFLLYLAIRGIGLAFQTPTLIRVYSKGMNEK